MDGSVVMKMVMYLSFIFIYTLSSSEIELDTIDIQDSREGIKGLNISGNVLKSRDLADLLSKESSSISLSRRGGIASDIVLRGQKRDNINVVIDGARIFGGCPNRMDPPISHTMTNLIDSIDLYEGPYDVENFGTLSGLVHINSKAPSKKFQGEINLDMGSFDYKKGSIFLSGGSDKVKTLFSLSNQKSGQYIDGSGNDFSNQLKKLSVMTSSRYQTLYEDMDAYDKRSFMGKLFIDTADNHELRLSYTANRSKDILYPSSPMDAIKDDSNLYSIGYTIKDIAYNIQKLDFLYYHTDVEHPMSNIYRNSSLKSSGIVKNDMFSQVKGLRLKSDFNLNLTNLTVGIDGSDRLWDGQYSKLDGININKSINGALTKNRALFVKLKKDLDRLDINFGARYDSTEISTDNIDEASNRYRSINANVFGTYYLDRSTNYFFGIGRSARVPDGRELYFRTKDMSGSTDGVLVGNDKLKQTINHEIDLGIEKSYDSSSVKTKIFYSKLKDYIYFNSSVKPSFFNIDADIYGIELSGISMLTDRLVFEYNLAYQRGKKETPLSGQSDRDLADIAPLRANISADFEYDALTNIKLSSKAFAKWDVIDSDNGEQELPGFATLDLRINRDINQDIRLTVGVDNIFDKRYVVSNTYNDLTLIATGGDKKVLMNEPGRYAYINCSYRF
jgi:iron complex outermembrane receptor protein